MKTTTKKTTMALAATIIMAVSSVAAASGMKVAVFDRSQGSVSPAQHVQLAEFVRAAAVARGYELAVPTPMLMQAVKNFRAGRIAEHLALVVSQAEGAQAALFVKSFGNATGLMIEMRMINVDRPNEVDRQFKKVTPARLEAEVVAMMRSFDLEDGTQFPAGSATGIDPTNDLVGYLLENGKPNDRAVRQHQQLPGGDNMEMMLAVYGTDDPAAARKASRVETEAALAVAAPTAHMDVQSFKDSLSADVEEFTLEYRQEK